MSIRLVMTAFLIAGGLAAVAAHPASADPWHDDLCGNRDRSPDSAWCRESPLIDRLPLWPWHDCWTVADVWEGEHRSFAFDDEARVGPDLRDAVRRDLERLVESVLERVEARVAGALEEAQPAPDRSGCVTEREERDGMSRTVVRCEQRLEQISSSSRAVSRLQSRIDVSVVSSPRAD